MEGAKRSGWTSDDPEYACSHCPSSGAMRRVFKGQRDQATGLHILKGRERCREGRHSSQHPAEYKVSYLQEPSLTTTRAKITALGTYVPPRVLSNADLEKMVDTTNEWILERVGIRERHSAA